MKHIKARLIGGIMIVLSLQSFFIFSSCKGKKSSYEKIIADNKKFIDSFETKRKVDSIATSILINIGKDDFDKAQSLSGSCPVKVIQTGVYNREYSSYKNFSITFQNVVDQPIDAIKFSFYGENNWGEPETINTLGSAYGKCESQQILSPHKSSTQLWQLETSDVTKIKAFVTKVHFVDGNVWDIDKH